MATMFNNSNSNSHSGSGSSTCVMEMHSQPHPQLPEPAYNGTITPPKSKSNMHPGIELEPRSSLEGEPRLVPLSGGESIRDDTGVEEGGTGNTAGGITGDGDGMDPPADATGVVSSPEKWNGCWINVCRVFGTFFSFTILGANDAAYGVSFVFLSFAFELGWVGLDLAYLVFMTRLCLPLAALWFACPALFFSASSCPAMSCFAAIHAFMGAKERINGNV